MDYEEYDDNPSVDIDYLLVLFGILKKLKSEWASLKKMLHTEDKDILQSISNIDNLLNYYYV